MATPQNVLQQAVAQAAEQLRLAQEAYDATLHRGRPTSASQGLRNALLEAESSWQRATEAMRAAPGVAKNAAMVAEIDAEISRISGLSEAEVLGDRSPAVKAEAAGGQRAITPTEFEARVQQTMRSGSGMGRDAAEAYVRDQTGPTAPKAKTPSGYRTPPVPQGVDVAPAVSEMKAAQLNAWMKGNPKIDAAIADMKMMGYTEQEAIQVLNEIGGDSPKNAGEVAKSAKKSASASKSSYGLNVRGKGGVTTEMRPGIGKVLDAPVETSRMTPEAQALGRSEAAASVESKAESLSGRRWSDARLQRAGYDLSETRPDRPSWGSKGELEGRLAREGKGGTRSVVGGLERVPKGTPGVPANVNLKGLAKVLTDQALAAGPEHNLYQMASEGEETIHRYLVEEQARVAAEAERIGTRPSGPATSKGRIPPGSPQKFPAGFGQEVAPRGGRMSALSPFGDTYRGGTLPGAGMPRPPLPVPGGIVGPEATQAFRGTMGAGPPATRLTPGTRMPPLPQPGGVPAGTPPALRGFGAGGGGSAGPAGAARTAALEQRFGIVGSPRGPLPVPGGIVGQEATQAFRGTMGAGPPATRLTPGTRMPPLPQPGGVPAGTPPALRGFGAGPGSTSLTAPTQGPRPLPGGTVGGGPRFPGTPPRPPGGRLPPIPFGGGPPGPPPGGWGGRFIPGAGGVGGAAGGGAAGAAGAATATAAAKGRGAAGLGARAAAMGQKLGFGGYAEMSETGAYIRGGKEVSATKGWLGMLRDRTFRQPGLTNIGAAAHPKYGAILGPMARLTPVLIVGSLTRGYNEKHPESSFADQITEGAQIGATIGVSKGPWGAAVGAVAGVVLNVITGGRLGDVLQQIPFVGSQLFGEQGETLDDERRRVVFEAYTASAVAQGYTSDDLENDKDAGIAQRAADHFMAMDAAAQMGIGPQGADTFMMAGRAAGFEGFPWEPEKAEPTYSADDIRRMTEGVNQFLRPESFIIDIVSKVNTDNIKDPEAKAIIDAWKASTVGSLSTGMAAIAMQPMTTAITGELGLRADEQARNDLAWNQGEAPFENMISDQLLQTQR